MTTRCVMILSHVRRPEAATYAETVTTHLERAGVACVGPDDTTSPIELVLALGGDGTMLAAAEKARARDVPLLGVNFGHMGFLTDVDADALGSVIDAIAHRSYDVSTRMALDVTLTRSDGTHSMDWAFNEAAILSLMRAQPAHLGVGIDGRGISTYGADGVIVATPTGSTAYSFSAGGPIVWPDVEAVVMAPVSAHGLFTRPLVISPSSVLEVFVLPDQPSGVEVWCDGRRRLTGGPGSTIRSTKSRTPVRLAHVSDVPFSGRLVRKFDLPIKGWRMHADD
ncbi:NAD kinase [Nanchangia anserum]|uniref:NAD kinase n=1 Tax=Nanchangia anserum TaxID=2692125 RepID=A0A8I0G7K6_9ACTO|nr:NAD kinase [Nanchangia anserum]MBD3688634.1 NAD kinase [Nanchangia anserum]QOX82395.1 NAD kinase [Nanchangia anserum]